MSLRINSAIPLTVQGIPRSGERIDEADFKFTLNRLDDEGLADRLDGLINDITTAGDKLVEHLDIRDMRHYRHLVKDFLNEVVTHSHEFSRENFLDRRGRHRVYGIVRLVDENLDELAQQLISSEKDRISVLDRVDEIRGLLLDIIA
ncbi:MAG: YaaR family protein [Clostridiales bacterium]|jgi:uncharacterized protein YaaR (DUF327 family)|nr:YaaR family protein [Clostridiales bacterium]